MENLRRAESVNHYEAVMWTSWNIVIRVKLCRLGSLLRKVHVLGRHEGQDRSGSSDKSP